MIEKLKQFAKEPNLAPCFGKVIDIIIVSEKSVSITEQID